MMMLLLLLLSMPGQLQAVRTLQRHVDRGTESAVKAPHWTSRPLRAVPLQPEFEHPRLTQQFQVVRQIKIRGPYLKQYNIELEKFLRADGEALAVGAHLSATVKPKLKTMHDRTSIELGNQKFLMVSPRLAITNHGLLGHYSWRVYADGDPDTILFTIFKHRRGMLRSCRYFLHSRCRMYWSIYRGQKKDNSLVYFGIVQPKRHSDELIMHFYRSKVEWKSSPRAWRGKTEAYAYLEAPDPGGANSGQFKLVVKPNEDAALMLVSLPCLDFIRYLSVR